jgi:hypothetical protein
MSYSFADVILHPRTHYAYGTATNIMNDLREAFDCMDDNKTCIAALQEADYNRWKQCSFSKDLAEKMVYDSNTSPGMIIICAIHS